MGRIAKPTASTVTFEPEINVPVNALELDMENNRVAHLTIKSKHNLEEQLWREAELGKLKADIKARGLQEPLILLPKGHTVAEGNCRLVCLKRLQHEAKTAQKDGTFEFDLKLQQFLDLQVPCKRIAKDTPSVDIDAYLTEIHVGRKKKWRTYNQAKLLCKLKDEDDLTLEEIARISRSSRPTISKKIEAYRYTTVYRDKFPNDVDYVKWFYYFWEFMHPLLDEFRRNEANVIKFMKWLHDKKFSNSTYIRLLPKILDDPDAFRSFEMAGITDARTIIMKADPTVTSPLYRKISSLANTLEALSPREFRLLTNDTARKGLLRNLIRKATELLKEAEWEDKD